MADTKPLLHTGPVPVIPVTPPPSRRSYTSAFTSQALRAVAVIATQFPHLAPWLVGHGAGSRVPGVRALSGIPVAGVLAALLYALGLPGWVAAIQRPARGQTGLAPVGRDEVFVQEKTYAHAVKNKKGKKKLVKVEDIDEFAVADPSSPTGSLRRGSIYSPFTWLPFGPGRGRLSSISSLLLNTLALLVVLDQCFSPKLLKHDELTYARVASITPHTATINLRLAPDASINPFDNTGIQDPPIPAAPVAAVSNELIYRPKYIDTAAPVLWEHFKIASTSKEQDWFGQVQLEGLQSGIMYQYRIKRGNGQMWPPYEEAPLNFTTSPDPRLSNKGNFKFIHAGQFRSQPSPYNPLSLLSPALIPWLPTSEPHIAPKPSHLLHLWRDYHLRQPAWRMLGDWLHDMRSRVAWAQIAFGLLGEEIELAGQTRWALGGSSGSEDRSRRGFMASRDVKDVYETLPVLAAHVHSPSEGAILEPGAISCPESSFAYANNHFYRLRKPTLERSARDSHDWMADLSELQTWLTAVNATSGFKFITSPVPLNPFFGGNSYETEWRTAVLDLLRYVPNTVVLSESKHGATASLLRRSVIEICSPPLSLASTPRWWPWSTNLVPDRTKATEETTSTWTRYNGQVVEDISHSTVDTLLRHYPLHPTLPSVRPASHTPSVKGRPIHAKSGSEYSSHAVQGRWTSLEVDTNGPEPLLKVTFWRNGAEGGKFDVHGKAMGRVGRLSRALGGEEETGWGWLKRWGLLPSSWF